MISCTNLGGRVAEVDNSVDSEIVLNLLNTFRTRFHLRLSREVDTDEQGTDPKSFKFQDGRELTDFGLINGEFPWSRNQPDNFISPTGPERCTEATFGIGGYWNDVNCDKELSVLCEFPCNTPTSSPTNIPTTGSPSKRPTLVPSTSPSAVLMAKEEEKLAKKRIFLAFAILSLCFFVLTIILHSFLCRKLLID